MKPGPPRLRSSGNEGVIHPTKKELCLAEMLVEGKGKVESGAGWGAYRKGAMTVHLDFMTSDGSKDRGSHVLGYSMLSFPAFPATYT